MLRSEELPVYQDMECFALSCPPVLSRSAAEICKPFITTVALPLDPSLALSAAKIAVGEDMISRLSLRSLQLLRTRALELLILCRRPKWQVTDLNDPCASLPDSQPRFCGSWGHGGGWQGSTPPCCPTFSTILHQGGEPWTTYLPYVADLLQGRVMMPSRASTRSSHAGRYSPRSGQNKESSSRRLSPPPLTGTAGSQAARSSSRRTRATRCRC